MENLEENEHVTLVIEMPQVIMPEFDKYLEMLLKEAEPKIFDVFSVFEAPLFLSVAIAYHDELVKTLKKDGWCRTYHANFERKRHPFLREYNQLTIAEQTKALNVFKKFQTPKSVERPDENQPITSPELPSRRKRTARAKKNVADAEASQHSSEE